MRKDKDIACVIWERKLISQKGPFCLFPAQRPHYRLTVLYFWQGCLSRDAFVENMSVFRMVVPGSDAFFFLSLFGSETQILSLIGKPTDLHCWHGCLILQRVTSTGANLSTCLMHFHFSVNKLTWHLELNKKKTELASNDSIQHNIKCEGVQREGLLKSEHSVSIYSLSLWDNKRRCFVECLSHIQ